MAYYSKTYGMKYTMWVRRRKGEEYMNVFGMNESEKEKIKKKQQIVRMSLKRSANTDYR